jgi:hypothetical protein
MSKPNVKYHIPLVQGFSGKYSFPYKHSMQRYIRFILVLGSKCGTQINKIELKKLNYSLT